MPQEIIALMNEAKVVAIRHNSVELSCLITLLDEAHHEVVEAWIDRTSYGAFHTVIDADKLEKRNNAAARVRELMEHFNHLDLEERHGVHVR